MKDLSKEFGACYICGTEQPLGTVTCPGCGRRHTIIAETGIEAELEEKRKKHDKEER